MNEPLLWEMRVEDDCCRLAETIYIYIVLSD